MHIVVQLALAALMSVVSVHWIFMKILKVAKMKGIVDNPSYRKLQKTPVPVLGGVAVFFGLVMGMLLFITMSKICPEVRHPMGGYSLVTLLSCSIIMLYVGALDDVIGLSPRARLGLEILTILLMIYGTGMCVDSFHGLWGVQKISWWFAVPLTVFAGVGLINAYNMVDGVNGLSSGLCIACSFILAAVFWKRYDYENCAMALCFGASLIPFLLHNVFGCKSRMFIGDAGTMVMGLLVTWFMIRVLSSDNPVSLTGVVNGSRRLGLVAMMLAIASVPVFDTLRVMTGRVLRHQNPFHADKTHLHHKFIAVGISHPITALSEILINLLVIGVWYLSYRLGASVTVQLYITVAVAVLLIWGTYVVLSRCATKLTATNVLPASIQWASSANLNGKKWWQRLQHRLDKGAYVHMQELLIEKLNLNYTSMDYKAMDTESIVNYLQGKKQVKVEDIKAESGAETLRVYPILFELEQAGIIKVLSRASLGAPEVVKLNDLVG